MSIESRPDAEEEEPAPAPPVPETLFVLLANASTDDAFIDALHLLDYNPALAAYRDRSGRRWTPLHAAIDRSAPRAVVSALLHAHPPAAAVADEEGNTPLHIAAWRLGSPAVLGDLARARPGSATAVDWYGNTPLHLASMQGAGVEIVRALLSSVEGGGHDGEQDGSGGDGGSGETSTRRQQQPHAAAAIQNYRGSTPLHDALSCGSASPAVAAALLAARPDVVSIRNEAGNTPLHSAVDAGSSPDVVRVLLRAGPGGGGGCPRDLPTTWRNADGHTPLGLLCHDYGKYVNHAIFCLDERGHDVGRVMTYHLRRAFEVAADMIRWSADGTLMAGAGGGNEDDGELLLSEERKHEESAALVHATARTAEDVPPELHMLIYRAHREELGTPDAGGGGNLPLHVACGRSIGGGRRRRRPGNRAEVDGRGSGGPSPVAAFGAAAVSAPTPDAGAFAPVAIPRPGAASNGGPDDGRQRSSSPPEYDPARDILSLYPLAARVTDAVGRLPLQIMVEESSSGGGGGRKWESGVRDLVRAYPPGVLALRLAPSAMPCALARVAGDAPRHALRGVFEIAREMPELVHGGVLRGDKA